MAASVVEGFHREFAVDDGDNDASIPGVLHSHMDGDGAALEVGMQSVEAQQQLSYVQSFAGSVLGWGGKACAHAAIFQMQSN